MKFGTLTIDNFMAIGEAKVNLADRGLVLIQGINDYESSADSNGAGKSSIADALSWVLYGTTARGESGDDIVNNETGKNCRVMVDVTEGDDVYRVTRYRKHHKGKNRLEVLKLDPSGTITELTKGTDKLTQSVVEQIIGCSHEVFCGAVYAGQERMPDLPGMTDKQLKMLIEEASGATVLEACYTEANTKVRAAEQALKDATAAVQVADRQHRDAVEMVTVYKGNETDWNDDRKKSILEIGAVAKTKKTEVEERIAELAGMGDAVIIRNRIEALDKQIAAVSAEQAQDRTNTNSLQIATRKADAAKIAFDHAKKALERARKDYADLDHQVGCPCSTCDRPFTAEDIEPAKKLANDKVADAMRDVALAKKDMEDAAQAHKSALETRDAYRASMTDVSKASAARAANQTKLDQIRNAERELERVKADLNRLIAQIKEKKDETNPWTGEIAKSEKLVLDRNNQLVEAMRKETEAQVAHKVAKHVADVYSPTGVRAFLLDDVTPFLNDQTAKYLGTLSDGNISATWTTLVKNAKGELREKFSIEVENKNGGKKFGLVSGGEKRKVRVACALALQDLVARRATKPIELFVGDEIDDALDASGQERLIQILEEKARERGSVFIISHADLKDWIRNQITVRRTGPRSTIEETTA
ncbi:AAA family ATPase [Bradyrhizobium sp. 179]|uniref:AAA family ATPase n=1 Tax=Bradyrhizobium sp. 179 TaxID=2782648 RepID=UPI001FFA7D9E|nr:AAA family ATPase [Bradyrhizobium sp. 179]MCK1543331.1 AAA family ATPase [Bradyrhizobium sp. 179]